MAKFSQRDDEMKTLEINVQHLEIKNISVINTDKIIGEGSSAFVSKCTMSGKAIACKKFKQPISRKAMLRAANTLVNLNHKNVVQFCGFSTRPPIVLMEYCYVRLSG